ncbi:MAG: hypothetical protein E6G08_20235 [Actinobacteria bacterium]|nr:MAG: hypothetical protein E6G08_20235 [Actinomycetota bacterium]
MTVQLDINGRLISLTRAEAERLRDEATAQAASSSALRDLSLVLDRAIRGKRVVALQHQEQRALARLLAQYPDDEYAPLRAALSHALAPARQ